MSTPLQEGASELLKENVVRNYGGTVRTSLNGRVSSATHNPVRAS